MSVYDDQGRKMTDAEVRAELARTTGLPYVPGSFADPGRTAQVEAEAAALLEDDDEETEVDWRTPAEVERTLDQELAKLHREGKQPQFDDLASHLRVDVSRVLDAWDALVGDEGES